MIKETLELAYLASGPLLVAITSIALYQIKIAKEQLMQSKQSLEINSKRDSIKLTAEQVRFFNESIIEALIEFDDNLCRLDIKIHRASKISVNNESIEITPVKDPKYLKNSDAMHKIETKVSNLIESFAIYFVSGVADEKIAYNSVATTYCEYVGQLLVTIMPLIGNNKHYSSMIKLYIIWKNRLEEEGIVRAKERIDSLLASRILGDTHKF